MSTKDKKTEQDKVKSDADQFLNAIKDAAKGDDPTALLRGVARQVSAKYGDVTVAAAREALAVAKSAERVQRAYILAATAVGMTEGTIASDLGISKGRVTQVKSVASLMRSARDAGLPMTEEEAKKVIRNGNTVAAKQAITDRDTGALATLTERKPKVDVRDARKVRDAADALVRMLGDVSLDPSDLADVEAALAHVKRATGTLTHYRTNLVAQSAEQSA